MCLKLAILDVLADHRGRGLKVKDIRRGLRTKIRSGNQQNRKLAALGDVDIVRLGLVSRNDVGWQITAAGLSFLESLKKSGSPLPESPRAAATAILNLVDDLAHVDEVVEMEARLRKFNTEIKLLDEISHQDAQSDRDQLQFANESDTSEIGYLDAAVRPVDLDATAPHSRSEENEEEPSAGEGNRIAPDADRTPPAFLQKVAGDGPPRTKGRRRTLTLATAVAAAKSTFLLQGLRLNTGRTNPAASTASEGKMLGGAAIILFALLGIAATVAGAIALSQIKSFQSENTALQREISKLKEQVVKVEQSVRAKSDLKANEAQVQSGIESRTGQAALNLSRDEIQLIKDYIKPVPPTGIAQAAIHIGDTINAATIPLPSPIMEKIPKLIGARFTIQNGAIIIFRKDSKKADAVLN